MSNYLLRACPIFAMGVDMTEASEVTLDSDEGCPDFLFLLTSGGDTTSEEQEASRPDTPDTSMTLEASAPAASLLGSQSSMEAREEVEVRPPRPPVAAPRRLRLRWKRKALNGFQAKFYKRFSPCAPAP